jgi:Domain of unknown function (DUF4440)
MNEADAWSIERECWLSGTDAYERWLSADAMVILVGSPGVLTRAAAVDALRQVPRWNDVAFESTRLVRPAPDVVILAYDAVAERNGGTETYRARCSSTYIDRGAGQWQLTCHQQSPL